MTASMVMMIGLNLGGTLAMEYQRTAIEPKSAIEIVRDLSALLKAERAKHQREFAVELRADPGASKSKLNDHRLRIAHREKKSQDLIEQIPTCTGIALRLGEAVRNIEKSADADKDARTKEALKAFADEGFEKETQKMQGRPRKEVIALINQILVAINGEAATQHELFAQLSQMITQEKAQLADCQRAADREDAAQRKLGGLNMAIFALDGALRVVGANPTPK
jgi:hypothetical protein